MEPVVGRSPSDLCEYVNPIGAERPQSRFVTSLRAVTWRPFPCEAAMANQYLTKVGASVVNRWPNVADTPQRCIEGVKALDGVIKFAVPRSQGFGSLPHFNEEHAIFHPIIITRNLL